MGNSFVLIVPEAWIHDFSIEISRMKYLYSVAPVQFSTHKIPLTASVVTGFTLFI